MGTIEEATTWLEECREREAAALDAAVAALLDLVHAKGRTLSAVISAEIARGTPGTWDKTRATSLKYLGTNAETALAIVTASLKAL